MGYFLASNLSVHTISFKATEIPRLRIIVKSLVRIFKRDVISLESRPSGRTSSEKAMQQVTENAYKVTRCFQLAYCMIYPIISGWERG